MGITSKQVFLHLERSVLSQTLRGQWTVPSHTPSALPDYLYSWHAYCSNWLFLPHRSRNVAYKHQVLLCPGHHCNVTNNSKRSGSNPLPLMVVRDSVGQELEKGTARVACPCSLSGAATGGTQGLGGTGLFWGSFTHMSVLGVKDPHQARCAHYVTSPSGLFPQGMGATGQSSSCGHSRF